MVKKISISISEHTYNKCIAHYHGNRSAYIEGLIDKGFDAENDVMDSLRSHNTKLKQENLQKDEELRKLKAEVGRIKKNITKSYTYDEIQNMKAAQQELMDKINLEEDQEQKDRLKFEFNKIQVELERINDILVDVWKREEEEAYRKRRNLSDAMRTQGFLRDLVKD
jgi:predicted RNase H-like nuclease (RuvC/YqgF family)